MQSFAALSMVFVTAISLVVGTRLLVVARRTRQLPELLFGLAFVCGGVGSAGAQLGQRLLWTEPGAFAATMNTLCGLLVSGSVMFLFVVAWRTFRPGSRMAAALAIGGCAVVALSFVVRVSDGSLPAARLEGTGLLIFLSTRFVVFAWNAAEALAYSAKLRRQLRLGLADPVAAMQILLWGIAGVAMMGNSGLILGSIGLGVHPLDLAWVTTAIVVTVCASSCAMWCAFFPPAALRRRLATVAPA